VRVDLEEPIAALPADRHAAAKARTRSSIVQAAAALMSERSGAAFSVDDLAERAGVSRRTVFNHFSSLGDVAAAVGAEGLRILVDSLRSVAPHRSSDPVADARADLARAVRASELFEPIVSLCHGLGLETITDATRAVPTHEAMLVLQVMHDVGAALGAELGQRHPEVDQLDLDLVVSTMLSGLAVIQNHWTLMTRASADRGSRAAWDVLLERLLGHVQAGSTSEQEDHHG
jgi:TetR/AcrR family transcriptional regulator, regulator of autoinduction and epiphytic fitness